MIGQVDESTENESTCSHGHRMQSSARKPFNRWRPLVSLKSASRVQISHHLPPRIATPPTDPFFGNSFMGGAGAGGGGFGNMTMSSSSSSSGGGMFGGGGSGYSTSTSSETRIGPDGVRRTVSRTERTVMNADGTRDTQARFFFSFPLSFAGSFLVLVYPDNVPSTLSSALRTVHRSSSNPAYICKVPGLCVCLYLRSTRIVDTCVNFQMLV